MTEPTRQYSTTKISTRQLQDQYHVVAPWAQHRKAALQWATQLYRDEHPDQSEEDDKGDYGYERQMLVLIIAYLAHGGDLDELSAFFEHYENPLSTWDDENQAEGIDAWWDEWKIHRVAADNFFEGDDSVKVAACWLTVDARMLLYNYNANTYWREYGLSASPLCTLHIHKLLPAARVDVFTLLPLKSLDAISRWHRHEWKRCSGRGDTKENLKTADLMEKYLEDCSIINQSRIVNALCSREGLDQHVVDQVILPLLLYNPEHVLQSSHATLKRYRDDEEGEEEDEVPRENKHARR